MSSTWILFVVFFNTWHGTATFLSQQACLKAKASLQQSLVVPYNDAKMVCVEDKGPKSL